MAESKSIALDNTVVQSKENIVGVMQGEKIILSLHNGKYYNLGQTGTKIWDIIEVPVSVTQLVNTLTSEYEVESFECEGEVVSFLENLLEEGLIIKGQNANL